VKDHYYIVGITRKGEIKFYSFHECRSVAPEWDVVYSRARFTYRRQALNQFSDVSYYYLNHPGEMKTIILKRTPCKPSDYREDENGTEIVIHRIDVSSLPGRIGDLG